MIRDFSQSDENPVAVTSLLERRCNIAQPPPRSTAIKVVARYDSRQPGDPVRAPAATRRPMKLRWASTVPAPKHRPRMSR